MKGFEISKLDLIKIGNVFVDNNYKAKKQETLTDILTTLNLKGQIVKTEYELTSEFMGQITKRNVPLATLSRCEIIYYNKKV